MPPRIKNEGVVQVDIEAFITAIDLGYDLLSPEFQRRNKIVIPIYFPNQPYGPIYEREAEAIKAAYMDKKVGFADVWIYRSPSNGHISQSGQICYSVVLYRTPVKPEPIKHPPDFLFQERII